MPSKFLCPALLIVLGACAAPQQRATTPNVRAESGALSQEEFLNQPWRSSNIRQTAMKDGRVKMLVMAIDKNNEVDPVMTEYLETELNALSRFPVESMFSGQAVAAAASELAGFGAVDADEGSNAQIGYLLEWKLLKKYKERTPDDYFPLKQMPVHLHEYWYEGPVNLFEIGGEGRKAIWADRTFRSRSSWKYQIVKRDKKTNRTVHNRMHDPDDPSQEDAAYDEAKSSMLFNFSKEVYSKLGRMAEIEGALKSGGDVLLSTPMGSTDGVVQGQPVFVSYRQGNLEVFLAKALAENPTTEGATLRVIQWKPGEALAEDFAADPTSFVSRYGSAIVARTEGLALPESWSERSAALDALFDTYVADAESIFGVPYMKKAEKQKILDLVAGQ